MAKTVSKTLTRAELEAMLAQMSEKGTTSASVEVSIPSAPRNMGERERMQAWMNNHINILFVDTCTLERVKEMMKFYNLNFEKLPVSAHDSVETAKDPEQAYSRWKFGDETPLTELGLVNTIFDWIDQRRSFYLSKKSEYAAGQILRLDALDQAIQLAFPEYVEYETDVPAGVPPTPETGADQAQ